MIGAWILVTMVRQSDHLFCAPAPVCALTQLITVNEPMQTLAEITMYPLQDEYIGPIDNFLAFLNTAADVEVKTNRMSTQLYGEHAAVMALLSQSMEKAATLDGKAAFVVKFLPGAERTVGNYD